MTIRTGRKFLLFITLLVISCSCSRNTVYSDIVNMPSEKWTLNNIAEYQPEITDTAGICSIIFSIRTSTSYPFRNIWLFVNTISPSGLSITDTIQYMLADEKGKWYGKGFGDIHELPLPYRKGIYFPEKGIYTFRVRHGMRIETLDGVYDLGLRIEKTRK